MSVILVISYYKDGPLGPVTFIIQTSPVYTNIFCWQVGASGSGKSTLAALLLRLYDPQQGNVMLDGVAVSTYDPAWLRSHIGAVSQVFISQELL
jgi:ABC-type multidrug transport system fused ATPase/permease subunit